MIGVYIHIPFCKNICNYCDFCKMLYNEKYIDNYLNSLSKEINDRYKHELVDTIYIGGGTPNSLTLNELDKLFKIIDIFNKTEDCEFTIECNIELLNREQLSLFKKNHVNRLSIGIESFNSDNIKLLGRNHNKKNAIDNIRLAKEYIDNINIDLIYGVNDRIDYLKEDIDTFLNLNLAHISCYSLIIEENTKLYIDKHKYIDENIDYEMYKYIDETLTSNGYIHYEISNYSKLGYESKHNLKYWNNLPYYGFGLGSVSYIDNYRINNTKNMHKYLDSNYQESSTYEDISIQKENSLILGLRLLDGIDYMSYNNKYNTNILDKDIIKSLIKENKLEIVDGHLRLNKDYIYIQNDILVDIIGSEL